MSVEVIEQQIERFLASEAPEVMVIKGDWGVGKTYAWNKYLLRARNQQKIALKKYSYVSLFGINSLSDLKFGIFENIVEQQSIGRKPTLESFKSNTAELFAQLGKKSSLFSSSEKTAAPYHVIFDTVLFLSLEKTIICIDDFERKGKGIGTQEILGLISLLKEQKKCKIVLILNEESLGEEANIDYVKLREKVIDSEVLFAPTAEECVGIALTRDRMSALLASHALKLKISNIRILKKIEKLADILYPQLKEFDSRVLERAMQTLTLLAWCYYSRSSEIPDYNFVLSRNKVFAELDDQALSIQQQGWCAILRHYDNFSLDEFDTHVARLVENGYLDEKALHAEAMTYNEKIRADHSRASFQAAWNKFNESFEDNTQEVIDLLSASFANNAKYISPANLDGAVRLLRYLGRNKLASKIIDLYIEKRRDEVRLFNLDTALLNKTIKDAEVITRFEQAFDALRGNHTIEDLLERLITHTGEHDEDEALLAQTAVDDYIAFFKKLREPQLSRYIDCCLQYGRLGGTTAYQETICDKATTALTSIGQESRLNASRVRRFGIAIDFR